MKRARCANFSTTSLLQFYYSPAYVCRIVLFIQLTIIIIIKNISELSEQDAENVMRKLALEKEKAFCNQRSPEYFKMRKYYEEILRNEFQKKGGKIERLVPHYMVVEECGFLESWYVNSSSIKIDINEFDISTL